MQYGDKLNEIEARFEKLSEQMADPEVIADPDSYRKVAKAHRDLEPVVEKYREYKKVISDLEGARQMLQEPDAEIREMAQDDIRRLEPRVGALEEDLKILLLPKDPLDDKNVVLEIRAGAGGDEATLFAGEIFRMYSRYAEEQ